MMQIPHRGRQHDDVPGGKAAFQDQFSHGNGFVLSLGRKQTQDADTLPGDSAWTQLSERRSRNSRNSLSSIGWRRRRPCGRPAGAEEGGSVRAPRSSLLSPLLRRGERKKKHAPKNWRNETTFLWMVI